MRTLLTFILGTIIAQANADEGVSRSEHDGLAARATAQLPRGWRIAERHFGPQQITMQWGARPAGLRVRLEGPHLWQPFSYRGPALTPAQQRAHFRRRPECICIWIVPRSYKPRKDVFLADWFRPDNDQTHRLASTATLDVYAYGGLCHSWPRWRRDLKRNLRK